MRILGLDLSLTSSGVATGPWSARIIRTTPAEDMGARLARIDATVATLVRSGRPDLAVIEGLPAARLPGGVIGVLGYVQGVVRLRLWREHITTVTIQPSQLQLFATGKGRADKAVVMLEASRRLGYEGRSTDESDALWLWWMAATHYGEVGSPVPQANARALERVEWPQLAAGEAPRGG